MSPAAGLPRRAAAGAAGWLCFSACAVLLRGVRWDEAYERAQVIAGAVAYPAWHPLYAWSHEAFTVFHGLAAAMQYIAPGPLAVGVFQQTLHIAAACVPAFLIASALARSTLAGHTAAVLMLAGAHLEFDSYYPLSVWPDRFTIAHIALGYAAIAAACLVFRRMRLAAFLLAAMPAIHIGLMPPLALLALATARSEYRRDGLAALRLLVLPALLGLMLPLIVAITIAIAAPPSDAGAAAAGPAQDAWDAYTRYTQGTDVHRAFPRFGPAAQSTLLLAAALLLAALGALREGLRGPLARIAAFLAIVAALYAAALAVQPHLAGRSLFLAAGWMPHRLPNLAAPIPIALAAALPMRFARDGAGGARAILLLLAAAAALRWIAAPLLPEACVARYIAPPETLAFLFGGAALAACTAVRPWLAAAPIAALAACHQTGALYAAAGAALYLVNARMPPMPRMVPHAAAACLLAALLASVLAREVRAREHLPATASDRAIAARVPPGSMVVTPGWDNDFQMRTGLPVLLTYETQAIASYMPARSAQIERMYADIYGYRFGERWDYRLDAWRSRSAAAWQALAARYGFRYVIAPAGLPLPLGRVLDAGDATLYEVAPLPGT